MENLLYAAVLVFSTVGIAWLLMQPQRPTRLKTPQRLPGLLEFAPFKERKLRPDAQKARDFLNERLTRFGFEAAHPLMAITNADLKLALQTYVHPEERVFVYLGLEQSGAETYLMLHVVTPLSEKRRVETTSLEFLHHLARPEGVALRFATDIDRVEQLYSLHRMALGQFARAERHPAEPNQWATYLQESYRGWLKAGVLAQRVRLNADGCSYRLLPRPRRTV